MDAGTVFSSHYTVVVSHNCLAHSSGLQVRIQAIQLCKSSATVHVRHDSSNTLCIDAPVRSSTFEHTVRNTTHLHCLHVHHTAPMCMHVGSKRELYQNMKFSTLNLPFLRCPYFFMTVTGWNQQLRSFTEIHRCAGQTVIHRPVCPTSQFLYREWLSWRVFLVVRMSFSSFLLGLSLRGRLSSSYCSITVDHRCQSITSILILIVRSWKTGFNLSYAEAEAWPLLCHTVPSPGILLQPAMLRIHFCNRSNQFKCFSDCLSAAGCCHWN